MSTISEQATSRTNELDIAGEARIYRMFKHFWHPVLYSHELGAKPQRVTLCGEHVVVVRLEGEVCAFADICAHRGTALSLGTVDNNELRCAYHGWQYNTQGHCTFVPQRPDLAHAMNARLTKYQAVERYGLIWVCLVDAPHFDIPEYHQYADPKLDLEHVYIESTNWECSAPRRTENYTDLGHFAILHDGILGFKEQPAVPDHEVWREGRALRMKLLEESFVESTDNPKYASMELPEGEEEVAHVHRTWWLFMPLTVLLHAVGPGTSHYCLFFHPTPVGPKLTRNFTISSRNFAKDKAQEELTNFVEMVYDQDVPIVESQRPEELPEDLSDELHLKGVDTFSVYYRKWLVELAKAIEQKAAQAA